MLRIHCKEEVINQKLPLAEYRLYALLDKVPGTFFLKPLMYRAF